MTLPKSKLAGLLFDAWSDMDRVLDVYDEACGETGFSAMERSTAFPASIVTIMATLGELPSGVLPLETAVPGEAFVGALERRGIPVRIARDGGRES